MRLGVKPNPQQWPSKNRWVGDLEYPPTRCVMFSDPGILVCPFGQRQQCDDVCHIWAGETQLLGPKTGEDLIERLWVGRWQVVACLFFYLFCFLCVFRKTGVCFFLCSPGFFCLRVWFVCLFVLFLFLFCVFWVFFSLFCVCVSLV